MAKKKQSDQITNRRASYDYQILDTFIAGLVLDGSETKALRLGRGDLTGSYINELSGELWLIGASIYGTHGIPISDTDQKKSRKLLLKKNEIKKLLEKKQTGNAIIPLKIMNKGRFIKIEIALAKGKRQYDKRAVIKKRETERNLRRDIKR